MCNMLVTFEEKIKKEQQQNNLKLQIEKLNTVGMTQNLGTSQIYFIEPPH